MQRYTLRMPPQRLTVSPRSNRNRNHNQSDMDSYDPLAEAIKPPTNESEQERSKRLKAEAEALRISKEIDAKISEENRLQDWRKKALKVLLLGQAESGKSTVLKSEQLLFEFLRTQNSLIY